jgi:hypothetical protein
MVGTFKVVLRVHLERKRHHSDSPGNTTRKTTQE